MQIYKSEIAEIVLTGGSNTLTNYFPKLPNLMKANTRTFGIETYSVSDVPVAPSGNPVLSVVGMKDCFLTLYYNNGEFYTRPLFSHVRLHDTVTSSTNHPFVFAIDTLESLQIVWEKSYVQFARATNFPGATTSILFNIYYKD